VDDSQERRDIRVPSFVQGGGDADIDHVKVAGIGKGSDCAKPARLDQLAHGRVGDPLDMTQARVDTDAASLIGLDADNFESCTSKGRSCGQADVAEADNADACGALGDASLKDRGGIDLSGVFG
jgi:hypothetical protein